MRKIFIVLCLCVAFFPAASASAEEYVAKYVAAYNAVTTGRTFKTVDDIYIDRREKEIYVLDAGNMRVVVLDYEGIPIFTFKLMGFDANGANGIAVSPSNGDVFISTFNAVAIFDYKGRFKRVIDFSKQFVIKSMSLSQSGNELYIGHIYTESGKNMLGIAVLDLSGNVTSLVKVGVAIDIIDITFHGDRFYFLSPSEMSVVALSREGDFLLRFGKASSLLGGFSQPASLSITSDGHIVVVDSNRMMVIAFDSSGTPLYEFGGFGTIAWPRKVAVDEGGRIFVADSSNTINVFEIYKDGAGGMQKLGSSPVDVPSSTPGGTVDVEQTDVPAR